MSSTYGNQLHLSIFGQSHGGGIGMTMDGIPAGLPVDFDKLQQFLNRRAPGQNSLSTPRKEEDRPEFLAGVTNGFTCGAPIAAMIRNNNTRSSDYDQLKNCPRPGHADYTAQIKHNGFQDAAGGGHFSGRLTAPLCIAGGLCKQWLEAKGINIFAHILQINDLYDTPFDPTNPLEPISVSGTTVLSAQQGELMHKKILEAKENGDSVGGVIECAITGLPAGIGDPMFDGLESTIAKIVFGVPAVKGVEFGAGFACASMYGSENNDAFVIEHGSIATKTNHAGGILGGISTGMPLIFRAAIKPTPSIGKPQQSICLDTMERCTLEVSGRHDPCIVPRAVPVIEAAASIAIFDALLCAKQGV